MPRLRRNWIVHAMKEHSLSREQAERIVSARSRKKLSDVERARAIEARLARVGLAQEDLAALVDCSQNEISKIVTGERQRIDPELAEAIGRELNLTRDQVMYGSPKPRVVKILGVIMGDEAVRLLEPPEFLEHHGFLPNHDILGYRVAVDTLEPRYRQGDVLLCPAESAALENCHGRECLVEVNGQRFVRIVEPGASVRVVTLRGYKASTPSQVDVKPTWISPITNILPLAAR